jgi:soluble lytic murein transglycosylase
MFGFHRTIELLTRATVPAIIALFLLTLAGCATPQPQAIAAAQFVPVSTPAVTAPSQPKRSLPLIASPEEGFGIALEAYKVGEMEAAGLYAESVMERYPATPWYKRSLFLLGRTFIARDMTIETEKIVLRIPTEYPDLADYALFQLAEHYFSKKRYNDAIGLYQRLINNYQSSSLVARTSLRKAQALHGAGLFRDAVVAYEQSLNDFPRSEQAYEAGLGLGKALADTGDLPASIKAFLNVRVMYPGNGNDAEVEKALAAIAIRGAQIPKLSADEQYERGKNLFRALQYDKAEESFRAALEADRAHPQRADMLLRSGIALYNLGRRPEAASTLVRLLNEKLPDCRCAEALNWLGKSYSRLGLRDEAVETYLKLVRMYPESDWSDDALYLTGNVYREANDMKRALKYYRRLAAEYPESSLADSAIWWQGWAYYNAGDYRKAMQTFQELISRYPRSFLVNQALYWQGRGAEKSGDRDKASRYYRKAMNRGPYTYYGYLAAERLSGNDLATLTVADDPIINDPVLEDSDLARDGGLDLSDLDGPPVWTNEAIVALSSYPAYRKTLELMYLGMKKEAATELWSLQELLPGRHGALIGLSKAFFELGDYYSSLIIVLRGFDRHLERPSSRIPEDLWLLAYPQGYWQSIVSAARRYGLDPFFVAAIIREESQFRSEALSPAGARGVMQVMPATGEWIARMTGIRNFDRAKLYDADINITIGTWYLSHLMKRFKNDLYLVSAAYNAGPEIVATWAGAVRGVTEPDMFVETIPYRETRGYVKKVLRNYAEYRRIYGRTDLGAPLSLSSQADKGAGWVSTGTVRLCGFPRRCP